MNNTNPISGIYCIYNLVNGKIYFGQSFDVENRIRKHKESLKGNYHKNDHLQKAFNKYGEFNFFFNLVLECAESERDFYEKKFINDFKTFDRQYGYNIQLGGHERKIMAEETKKKLSNALKGRITNPENHAKLIATQKKGKHPRWIQEVTIENVVKDYQSGIPIDDICEKYNVSTTVVWGRLRDSGIELNRATGLRPHKHYDITGIVKDFQEGMSRRKLAIKYGHARNTITKILESEGVV